jgi:Ni2+-binding GTPase involved in maturation of urease and hydrogenase
MKLHIVGGFLGSGKTTAINNAAGHLASKGKKVGVITNEQSEDKQDKTIVHANYSPSEVVINNSFSSNLDNLSDKVVRLHLDAQPGYIFAESVGSCTDLVATVLKPLMILYDHIFESLTLSIIVDARMLLSYLKGEKQLFGDEVIYIFRKQIEEADLLVINKIDLLVEEDFPVLKKCIHQSLNDKLIITQNSFNPQNIDNWLDTLESLPQRKRTSLEIDYQSYGKGETALTWLDEEITFSAMNNQAGEYALRFIDNMLMDIYEKQLPIGHLTFRLIDGTKGQEISITTYDRTDLKKSISPIASNKIMLIMNARFETTYEILNAIVNTNIATLSNQGVNVTKKPKGLFSPGIPKLIHHSSSPFRCCEECICLKKLLARNEIRKAEGSEKAMAELEDENFECLGLCGECGEGNGCCC